MGDRLGSGIFNDTGSITLNIDVDVVLIICQSPGVGVAGRLGVVVIFYLIAHLDAATTFYGTFMLASSTISSSAQAAHHSIMMCMICTRFKDRCTTFFCIRNTFFIMC